MPFVLEVHLLDAAYQAASLGRDRAEWPPHPARLFCALVSVADPDDPVQDTALEWLENQPAPLVRVPAESVESASPRAAWVPTNMTVTGRDKVPTHGVLPGRTNGGDPKRWHQRTLPSPELTFVWEREPPDGVRAVLADLARAVPYLGRATGTALVRAAVDPDPVVAGERWQVWEPAGEDTPSGTFLRTPYPGYVRRLREAHDAGWPAWEQARSFPYVPRGPVDEDRAADPTEAEEVPGPFEDLVTFAFDRGVSVDPVATLRVASSLRRKVMGMLETYGHDVTTLPALHGRTDSDQARSCAYLGLPFVGHEQADGRLRGVAVAVPRGLEARQRKALLAVLLHADGGLRKLAVPGFTDPVPLTYVGPAASVRAARWTVRPRTWTRPSRVWSTALPMVLDHFPKRDGRGIEASVSASCRMAGLPEPARVEVVRTGSFLPGARQLPGSALRRKTGERPLPGRHVRLHFDELVAGPVVLGSKRNFGLGLCLPGLPSGQPADQAWETGRGTR